MHDLMREGRGNPALYLYMECGAKTHWFELALYGRVNTFTACWFGSEAFLQETLFNLIPVEF